jgi:hypothetical protein
MLALVTHILQNGPGRDSQTVDFLFQLFTGMLLDTTILFLLFVRMEIEGMEPAGGKKIMAAIKNAGEAAGSIAQKISSKNTGGVTASIEHKEHDIEISPNHNFTPNENIALTPAPPAPIIRGFQMPAIKPIESKIESEIKIAEKKERKENFDEKLYEDWKLLVLSTTEYGKKVLGREKLQILLEEKTGKHVSQLMYKKFSERAQLEGFLKPCGGNIPGLLIDNAEA